MSELTRENERLKVIKYRGECPMHHTLSETYGPLVCKQCADEDIARLKADNTSLTRELAELKECCTTMDHSLAESDAENERLERELADATQSYRDLEPCGHAKNFLMGDEYGHFTCVVCGRDKAQRELAEERERLDFVLRKGLMSMDPDVETQWQSREHIDFEMEEDAAKAQTK